MASSTGPCVPRKTDDFGGEVILPPPLWGKQGREPLVAPPMVTDTDASKGGPDWADPSKWSIQHVRQMGLLGSNTKAKILDLRRECGTMLKLLDFAEYFVTSNIRREFVIGETGMHRKEIPEIPAEAIREAVANALCHRDYTVKTAVQVNVFMDTVRIVSPGLFPKGDSPEHHLDGAASEFGLRNPAIARALFRAGVIEQYGTGIPRIKEACEAAGVRFRFEQTVNSTVVAFERPGAQITVTGSSHDSETGTRGATDDAA